MKIRKGLLVLVFMGALFSPIYSQSVEIIKNPDSSSAASQGTGNVDPYKLSPDQLYSRAERNLEDGYYETVKEDVLSIIRNTDDPILKKKAFDLMDKADSRIETSYSEIRNWAGPRIGAVGIIDEESQDALEEYGASFPVVSAFGWQFEYRFISGRPDEKVAGLIIFAPMILGIDQSAPMLSLNMLIGLRLASEFEVAVGPHALISPVDPYFHVGIVIALGQNFKAAKLNFPINVAAVLGKDMIRAGVFFGFNTMNTKK